MKNILLAVIFLLSLPQLAFATQVVLTSGSTWKVPVGWNSFDNTIEVVGGGGAGSPSGGGGGGGAYARRYNISLTIGSDVTYSVGVAGRDTYFNGSSCASASACANGGSAGSG